MIEALTLVRLSPPEKKTKQTTRRAEHIGGARGTTRRRWRVVKCIVPTTDCASCALTHVHHYIITYPGNKLTATSYDT